MTQQNSTDQEHQASSVTLDLDRQLIQSAILDSIQILTRHLGAGQRHRLPPDVFLDLCRVRMRCLFLHFQFPSPELSRDQARALASHDQQSLRDSLTSSGRRLDPVSIRSHSPHLHRVD